MALDNWDEIRTAYQVARRGTVSGAAEALGVHHATVIRHVDALEARLGVKLFQRHARGYTSTEAGTDLFGVAQATEDQFTQLVSRIRGRGEAVSGDLVLTSLPGMAKLLTPVLADFQAEHPEVIIRYLTDTRVFRLEYGEAHVAIRAGTAPQEPDNVVQPFYRQHMALYAHRDYLEKHGVPGDDEALKSHYFVGSDFEDSRAPFDIWMRENIAREQVIYRTAGIEAGYCAVKQGVGIGFLPMWLAKRDPDLVEVMPSREEWVGPSWIVTHVDLHRTPKVQTFLAFLKERAKEWPCANAQ